MFAARRAGGEGAVERGAFFRRRDASEGLGVDEELPAEGRLGRTAFAGTKRRSGFPPDEAVERNARLDDGSGCAALPEGRWTGEPSFLSRPRLDGEPQRARCGGRGDLGDGNRGTRGGGARFELERLPEGATLGADKNYDAEAFVEGLKARGIEPHVAINGTVSKTGKVRKTAVPRTTSRRASAMGSANGCASASKKASAGARQWAASRK